MLFRVGLIPMDHRGWELFQEGRVAGAGLHADAQNSCRITLCINVDKVQLGFGAMSSYGVFGGSVDVPTGQVDGGVVICEAGVASVVAFFVRDSESWTESPVVEIAII